jgi:hypothetical protein
MPQLIFGFPDYSITTINFTNIIKVMNSYMFNQSTNVYIKCGLSKNLTIMLVNKY